MPLHPRSSRLVIANLGTSGFWRVWAHSLGRACQNPLAPAGRARTRSHSPELTRTRQNPNTHSHPPEPTHTRSRRGSPEEGKRPGAGEVGQWKSRADELEPRAAEAEKKDHQIQRLAAGDTRRDAKIFGNIGKSIIRRSLDNGSAWKSRFQELEGRLETVAKQAREAESMDKFAHGQLNAFVLQYNADTEALTHKITGYKTHTAGLRQALEVIHGTHAKLHEEKQYWDARDVLVKGHRGLNIKRNTKKMHHGGGGKS
ncbi:hypothetical protein BDV95DRAFT_657647 [Massariosphaeria phaeospora]|uniref:Uncharacterized protein n=1 Tax=Massariosphaeria phaeospora TaxID=100035 RepID=A0A7C8IBJ2_9PLEO|nr:hypothetical protein BDV95DRAFT_657647 [Massariosphaeria phaeospora]